MFEAVEQGLGTVWVNFFTPDKAKELFDLPENEVPVLLMPIGYADPDFKPLPNHTAKKALSEIVKEL